MISIIKNIDKIIIILSMFFYLKGFSQYKTPELLCEKVIEAIIKNDSIAFKKLFPTNKLAIQKLKSISPKKISDKSLVEYKEAFDNGRKHSTTLFNKTRQQYLDNNIDLSNLKFESKDINLKIQKIYMSAELNNEKFKHINIGVLPIEGKYYLYDYVITFSEARKQRKPDIIKYTKE